MSMFVGLAVAVASPLNAAGEPYVVYESNGGNEPDFEPLHFEDFYQTELTVIGDYVFMADNSHWFADYVWVSDGTTAGTRQLPIKVRHAQHNDRFLVGSELLPDGTLSDYLAYFDAETGTEGTVAGTANAANWMLVGDSVWFNSDGVATRVRVLGDGTTELDVPAAGFRLDRPWFPERLHYAGTNELAIAGGRHDDGGDFGWWLLTDRDALALQPADEQQPNIEGRYPLHAHALRDGLLVAARNPNTSPEEDDWFFVDPLSGTWSHFAPMDESRFNFNEAHGSIGRAAILRMVGDTAFVTGTFDGVTMGIYQTAGSLESTSLVHASPTGSLYLQAIYNNHLIFTEDGGLFSLPLAGGPAVNLAPAYPTAFGYRPSLLDDMPPPPVAQILEDRVIALHRLIAVATDGTPSGTRVYNRRQVPPGVHSSYAWQALDDKIFCLTDNNYWRSLGKISFTPSGDMESYVYDLFDYTWAADRTKALTHAGNKLYFVTDNHAQVRLMAINATIPGDTNCDGTVDFFDIDPFVTALLDAGGYADLQPTCDRMSADTNEDGYVDYFDIDVFVQLLLGAS
jgi:hypothetical protein